jgi:calcineurin-like phosphoesterase family protein
MNVWVIADTHFNHKNMVTLCGRPENFTELILSNWRGLCRPDDLTIHLGDVIFGQAGKLTEYLASVPGRKWLVRGNHDYNTTTWYLNHGFDAVVDAMVFSRVLFTHKPADVLPSGCVVNVHGHLHNSQHHEGEYKPQPWHKLLALEYTDYKPVELMKFVGKERSQNYGDTNWRNQADGCT